MGTETEAQSWQQQQRREHMHAGQAHQNLSPFQSTMQSAKKDKRFSPQLH